MLMKNKRTKSSNRTRKNCSGISIVTRANHHTSLSKIVSSFVLSLDISIVPLIQQM